MSVTMSNFQTVQIPGEGIRMAHVDSRGNICIYPQGLGVGPQMVVSPDDWRRICKEVRLAQVAANNRRNDGD